MTIIGIDLGTTNSLCAYFVEGVPRLVPNSHDSRLTPSVIAVTEDGAVLVGETARAYQVLHPTACASRFKQWMGTERTIPLRNRVFTPPELSSLVLRSLREDAERHLKIPVNEAVITVPAYFNDKQRRATRLAAKLAGLEVRRIINEPTAAALTYGFHQRDAIKHLMVLDLGGGTFDVSIMEVFEGSLEIVSTAGENFLGGEEFTDRLLAHACREFGLMLEQAELTHPQQIARLRQSCELAKRRLMSESSVSITLPEVDGAPSEVRRQIAVSQAQFAELSQSLLERLKGPISKALRDSHRRPTEIDDIILVGGATRMRPLCDFARDFLQSEPRCDHNPDEVVALGAAIQAALITNDAAIDDMVMTDVCPHTLGVDIVKDVGGRRRTGYFAPVIHRNTTIPVSREETFYTVYDNQTEVVLDVYQGESRHVSENTLLGRLTVKGIPTGPQGIPIVVRFTYDLNGILEVESFVENAEKRFKTVITSGATDLSQEELKAAVEKMQQYKFFPRDDRRNLHLLYYAERCVEEVNPMLRANLEAAIDRFELAMASADRELFAQSRENLVITLSSLDVPYLPETE